MSEEGENIRRLRFCVYPYSAMSNRDPIDQPILVPMGEYKRISRRELLRVARLAVSGALLVPSIQKRLIHGGLALSDWASAKFFRQGLRAPTFRDSEVTPFASFPYNYSSLLDPGINLDNWSLRVEGLVQRPGNYSLAQIQALPKIRVCRAGVRAASAPVKLH